MWTTITQWTHWTPDPRNDSHAGTLYAGRNYFYCWAKGQLYHNSEAGSVYWLRTDDDSGNRDVYVSVVNLDEAGWDGFFAIFPSCTWQP
ncbi:hypothetical protein ACFVTC_19045 [Streptomyces sp. NPDC057950]|uniref:hypothetical protein n=1 Tax=Streptomyces sp. NPDC057950 TaxID=3346288 RepID=UPI0036E311F5